MRTAEADDGVYARSTVGPVVAAAHLADGAMPALSEIEFAMTIMNNAFHRWVERCMGAAGVPGLAATDVFVLHATSHNGHERTLAEICRMHNVEDAHLVAYSLNKLKRLGLVETGRRGKETTARATAEGDAACRRYREVREALLVSGIRPLRFDEPELRDVACRIRSLTGLYDQAARAASSM